MAINITGRKLFLNKFWLIDFESNASDTEEYVVKEIYILNSQGTECYNYLVKSPKWRILLDNSTINYQYNGHRIPWNYGEFSFREVIDDIWLKVGTDTLYVKGLEKQRFLDKYFFKVLDLNFLPSLRHMNSCTSDRCELKHGTHCARRKVCELKHYIDSNNIH